MRCRNLFEREAAYAFLRRGRYEGDWKIGKRAKGMGRGSYTKRTEQFPTKGNGKTTSLLLKGYLCSDRYMNLEENHISKFEYFPGIIFD